MSTELSSEGAGHVGVSCGSPGRGADRTGLAGRFTIRKAWELNGVSHELRLLPEGHKCRRNHGHNYVITIEVAADRVDRHGMVTDFADLEPFGCYLKDSFDHRLLNDCVDFHPTSELFARHLGGWFIAHIEPRIHGRLVWVEVAETRMSAAVWHRLEGS